MHLGQHLGSHIGEHIAGGRRGIVGLVPGYGADGAATFVLSLESGAMLQLGWSTDILTSYSGKETRSSPFGQPKRRFEGVAFLLDGQSRDARGQLMRSAASGAIFLLALPTEELSLIASSSADTVFVASTARADWAVPRQRVAVVAGNGAVAIGVVQSVTPTSIELDITPGPAGRQGGRIMPLLQVLLDPQQGFARYPIAVDLWTVHAQAAAFGWAGVDSMGRGAELLQFAAGLAAVDALAAGDLLIWDRPNEIDGTANESLLSGAETVDLGGLPLGIGGQDTSVWARSLKFHSTDRADWAWFKAFTRRLRGRQGAFLLSTNRPDLLYVSTVAGGIKVSSSTVAGAGDYASWFESLGHRRLALTLSTGARQYVEIDTCTDNLDGTLTLVFTSGVVSGIVTKVSLLEQVRFDRDDLEVEWTGAEFAIDEVVRVVPDPVVISFDYRDGSDGTHVMDGVTAVPGCALTGSEYKATRECKFVILTINVGVSFNPAGYPQNVNAMIVNNGRYHSNGGAGGLGGTFWPGVGAYTSATLPSPIAGQSGAIFSGGAGAAGLGGGASNAASYGFSTAVTAAAANGGAGVGGGGGNGGYGSIGGSSGATVLSANAADVLQLASAESGRDHTGTRFTLGGGAGGGAGGTSGQGGGSGAGGGWAVLRARRMSGTGSYEVRGGDGGVGDPAPVGVPGGLPGGSGGGGPGGVFVLITGARHPPTPNVAGGIGGGVSSDKGGNGGAGAAYLFRR